MIRLPATTFALGFAILGLTSTSAPAEEFTTRMFGKDVSISAVDDMKKLVVDGVELVRDRYVDIEEIGIVEGMPVLVDSSSNTGNACSGPPFVVSFPPGGKPRMDGPLGTCSGLAHEMSSSGPTFFSAAMAGSDGERWA